MNRRFFLISASAFATTLMIASCTKQAPFVTSNSSAPAQSAAAPPETIKVGVWAVTSEDILKFVKEKLAAEQGLDIQIVKFNDWVQPNAALKSGEIDANFFQHKPFMQNANKEQNLNLVMLNVIALTPMGIYSKKYKSLNEVPDGATVAIYSDASNGDRCLRSLANNNLLKLRETLGEDLATLKDVVENPKNLKLKELEGPAIVRSLEDVDLALFSAGLRIQAKLDLKPLVEESVSDKRYAVGLATVQGKENDTKIQKLNQLLVSPKVKDFINEKYQGNVLAVF